jgi:hydrogenase expression/formation protein HypC
MCLAVPGQVLTVAGDDPLLRTGKVSFGGVVKDVSFAYVPDVQPGQYVIVHVGFALQIVDEEEAKQVFAYLREMGELQELEEATQ